MAWEDPHQYGQTIGSLAGQRAGIYQQNARNWQEMFQPWYDLLSNWYTQNQAMARQTQEQAFQEPHLLEAERLARGEFGLKELEQKLKEREAGLAEETFAEEKRAAGERERLARDQLELERQKTEAEQKYQTDYLNYLKSKDAAEAERYREETKKSLRSAAEAYAAQYAAAGVPKDENGIILWGKADESANEISRIYQQAFDSFLNDPAYNYLTATEKKSLSATSTRNFTQLLLREKGFKSTGVKPDTEPPPSPASAPGPEPLKKFGLTELWESINQYMKSPISGFTKISDFEWRKMPNGDKVLYFKTAGRPASQYEIDWYKKHGGK